MKPISWVATSIVSSLQTKTICYSNFCETFVSVTSYTDVSVVSMYMCVWCINMLVAVLNVGLLETHLKDGKWAGPGNEKIKNEASEL